MSPAAARRLALLGWLVGLAFVLASVVFLALSPAVEPTKAFGPRGTEVMLALAFLAYATVGALVLARSGERLIGALLLAAALAFETFAAAFGYAAFALVERPGALPAGEVAAWLSSWVWVPGLTLLLLLFLVFPTGELLSPRWRIVAASTAATGGVGTLALALSPEPDDFLRAVDVESPVALDQADAVLVVADWMLFPLAALIAASVVLRYRRSRGEERLQLKWFVTAAVLFLVVLVGSWVTESLSSTVILLFTAASSVALVLVPVAIGIAIFRYRLYEIDLIIRGTVVYSSLSALLLGLYLGSVIGLQQVFSSFAGGSSLAIAVSTLVVAAIVRPVRARIQSTVDRRFYRHRYDARRTLESFGKRLRATADLDALERELRAVANETLQPAHVSIWIGASAGAGEKRVP